MLFFIPLHELHLLLGAVKTIFKKMLVEYESVPLELAMKCNVSVCVLMVTILQSYEIIAINF